MRLISLALMVLLLARPGVCQKPTNPVFQLIQEGVTLYLQGKMEAAEEKFRTLLKFAREIKDPYGEAEAHRCLGTMFNKKGDFKLARAELEIALELHKKAGNRLELGRTLDAMGYNEWGMGNRSQAREFYIQALTEFDASGDKGEVALQLYNIALTSNVSGEREKWILRALEAARAVGNKRLEGVTFHLWGDDLFRIGDYRRAIGKLLEALRLLEQANETEPQAGVLISLGRLYLTHMRPEKAIAYYRRALEIAQKRGNTVIVTYCLRSIGSAQEKLGRSDEAMASFDENLAVARNTGSPKLIHEALVNCANALNHRGRYAEARALLKDLPPQEMAHRAYTVFSESLRNLGEYQAAADIATVALENAAKVGVSDSHYFVNRALAYDKLGQREASLSDIRRALAIVESNREKLIPTDYLKRGFDEGKAGLYEMAIDLFHRAGLPAEAFEVAEKARARAFMDLVASRDLQSGIDDPPPADTPEPVSGEEQEPIELQSLASAPAISLNEAQNRARVLGSTVLSYWVGKDAAWIWIVPPEGEIRLVSVAVTAERLRQLVQQTNEPNLGLTRGANSAAGIQLSTRGINRLPAPRSSGDPWRDLHRILVEPVAGLLPPGQGKSITIVPHGPLFRLSFAALKNARSRYLIEDFTLNYVPSIGLPGFSSAAKRPEDMVSHDYFLVANPRRTPPGPEGKPLPALPGAQSETADVARSLQKNSFTLLTGLQASEPAVRSNVANKHVIHFATHGVLLDDQPFESYLALGRAAASPSADGRLTAAEIYTLRLKADLVVLSACRTGLGAVTGDGVNGLTRAFFYAGANTVMATLWDVPDQPTNRLIARFYQNYQKNGEKSAALRTAQLALLNGLRKGEIAADTPLGPVKLPENPFLWAGFVVIGKP